MTLDLDELERKAKAATSGELADVARLARAIEPSVVLALIERLRIAEAVGDEWRELQCAAGFPDDGMTRSVKDVRDSVVLMRERVRELETANESLRGQVSARLSLAMSVWPLGEG